MKRQISNMIKLQTLSGRVRPAMVLFAMLAMWATNGAAPIRAQQPVPPTFHAAAEASQALFQEVQGNNEEAIANILGGPTELTSSGEKGQDKLDRELFAQRYQEMHRLGREPDGSATLYIGVENWPFPIPLAEKNGSWRFYADAGQKEVLFRRVGENELTAIAICHEFVAAERQYRAKAAGTDPTESSAVSLVAETATGSAV